MPTKHNPVRIIEFIAGNLNGQRAYVTYDDDKFMRVTLVNGNPLCSIELETAKGGFIEVAITAKRIPACPNCASYATTRLPGGVVYECSMCDSTFVESEVTHWRAIKGSKHG